MTLVRLAELRDCQRETTTEKLLDVQIADTSRSLHILEAEQMKLSTELEDLQHHFAELEAENETLEQEYQKPPDPTAPSKGSFFQQLRQVEAQEERLQASYEAIRSTVHKLRDEIKSHEAKSTRLLVKRDNLREQATDYTKRRAAKKAELKQLNDRLFEKDEELLFLTDTCEEIKTKIKEESADLQEFTPEYSAKLQYQYQLLRNTIQERTEYLEKIRNQEAARNSQLAAKQNFRKKDIEKAASPMKWMGQRAALIAKVKKMKQELALIENRERSATKSASRNQQQREEINWNETEIKQAIIAEIKSFKTGPTPFMVDTLNTEKACTQILQNKLKDIEKAHESIVNHKTNTTTLLTKQEELATKGDRIELLKDELQQLRGLL